MALRCDGQILTKKIKAGLHAKRYFFLAERMTIGTTSEWSGTPIKAGLSPAAAHLQAAASAADLWDSIN